ncbi:MAG: TMEM165/GDT1 family protein [Gammaproteobacteria bacterium]|nr:TMEM165/GDT1 family protein [Gammaproteobacteria bacterium]MDH3469262.1 TMEM165/GDT1 family protein [Gammaproteobacteria bacterium]
MDIKLLLIVFGTVFIAELGDKTQLATLLFAADKEVSKLTIFFAACAALIASSAIAVVGGAMLARYINETHLRLFAGVLFIVIGCWTLWGAKS